MSVDLVFMLLYLLFVFCVVYPPNECVAAGLTIPNLFSSLLGDERYSFVAYHIRRADLTLFIYSFLPFCFVVGTILFGYDEGLEMIWFSETLTLSKILLTAVIILPFLCVYQINSYGTQKENHPIVGNLKKFANNNTDWKAIAEDISREFRSHDKIIIQTSPICQVIATDNWIIKVTPLNLFFAHQSDANLVIKHSDTHDISHLSPGVSQYLTIDVQSSRVQHFKIRLNTDDFKDLQDKYGRSIVIPPGIEFHKTSIEKFLEIFRAIAAENVTFKTSQELEMCFGCMQEEANVKLQKLCVDAGHNDCATCYCKPMWCVDCMGRWFGHRQNNENCANWLEAKCTCPMCKQTFCLRDVCYVEKE